LRQGWVAPDLPARLETIESRHVHVEQNQVRPQAARESESLKPSRTTSWSSTMRQVISEGVDTVRG